MNTFLAVGQIIVSIGLIASVLLQARGTGLSGAFGGDSAVYRSRRGVERRLWQFTIILAILLPSSRFRATSSPRQREPAAPGGGRPVSRRDGAFVLVLVVILCVLGGAIAAPAFAPAATPRPTPSVAPIPIHREAVIGRPSSVTP